MAKDEKDTKDATAEAPKKSKKMLFIIIAAVVLLGGGGAGAYFMFFKGDSAEAAEVELVKGEVISLENALTINLSDGHYLKLGFAMQMTEEATGLEVDTAEAIDLAIEQYTGMEVAELETEKGRTKVKAELLEKIEKAHNVDDHHLVMGLYFTSFVTQ